MAADINLEVLHDFEKVISKYAEDNYVHVKDTFRKKEAMIKEKENSLKNFMSLMNLLGNNGNGGNDD
jgi:hypothetical protein